MSGHEPCNSPVDMEDAECCSQLECWKSLSDGPRLSTVFSRVYTKYFLANSQLKKEVRGRQGEQKKSTRAIVSAKECGRGCWDAFLITSLEWAGWGCQLRLACLT